MMQNENKKIILDAFQAHTAAKIRAARAWLRWSLDDAQELSGIPRTYISQIEVGRRIMTEGEAMTLHRLFREHGVNIVANGLEAVEAEKTNPKA
jgi:hypothetical protein